MPPAAAGARPATPPPVLRVADLEVDYQGGDGQPVRVVDRLGLTLAEGEVLGILGESGSGKTTLARAVLGILPPGARITGGSIRLAGRELVGLPEPDLEKLRGGSMAMIFQEPGLALSPVLKVGRQIADVVRAHRGGGRGRAERHALRVEVEDLLARVRFAEPGRVYDAYPHQLSGGQQQRVVVARAIAGGPRLLIADEPTSAVDATVQREILAILEDLRDELGLAILFISHDPALLAGISDHVLVVYAGRLAEIGARADLFAQPLHPYTAALLACAPRARPADHDRLATIAGAPPDPARPGTGCRFEPRCPERLAECARREPEPVEPEPGRRVRCFLHGG